MNHTQIMAHNQPSRLNFTLTSLAFKAPVATFIAPGATFITPGGSFTLTMPIFRQRKQKVAQQCIKVL